MTQEIILLHRAGSERFAFSNESEATAHWFSFKTCMRHILVGTEDSLADSAPELSEADELYRGEDAHRFLLQVVCGLHSPLVGETEVYGQFKNAVTSHTWLAVPASTQLQKFFRSLFEDAKRIRQAHLEDLGSQSYGSIMRREIRGMTRVHILGAGHLVQEILPWIAKDGIEVHIHCRNPHRAVTEFGATVAATRIHPLNQTPDLALAEAEVVLIAAPVSAEWIRNWIPQGASPSLIADLRGDSHEDRITEFSDKTRVLALSEFFERISGNQAHILARKNAALAAIDAAVHERSRHVEYRPFGWEDVCA